MRDIIGFWLYQSAVLRGGRRRIAMFAEQSICFAGI